jgi:hypothetical protein
MNHCRERLSCRALLRRAKGVLIGVLLSAGLGVSTVLAQPHPLPPQPTFAWNAPPGCPNASQIQAEIDALVSGSRSSGTSQVLALGTVTEHAGRWKLEAHIGTPGGLESRSIDADACAMLADAFALIVATAVDPSAVSRRNLPVAAAITPPPVATTTEKRDEKPMVTASRPASSPMAIGAGPLAAAGAGHLPLPAFGLGARIAFGARPRWEIAGLYWFPHQASVPIDGRGEGGANVRLASVQPSICLPWGSALATCLGADVGAMHAAGTGVPLPASGTSLWLATAVALTARIPVNRFLDFRFRADVGMPFFRPSFVLENVGPVDPVGVYRPDPVFAFISFQPEIRFSSTDASAAGHDIP